MPAVQVRSPRKGYLLAGEGIHDFTITPRLCQARLIQCPAEAKGTSTIITRGANNAYIEEEVDIVGPELECTVNRFEVICNLLGFEQQQKEHEHTVLNIRNGELFPQGRTITLNIDGAYFRGTFSGTYFTIIDRRHPKYDDWDHQACHAIDDPSFGLKRVKGDTGAWEALDGDTAYKYIGTPITLDLCASQGTTDQEAIGGPAASWEAYEEMESAGFHWCPAGSEVLLEEEAEILNIVSLLPGTVNSVAAYYTMPTGRQLLMEVPTDYYTVYNTDYVGYDVVEIGLSKNLNQYDENWGDQLYVSFISTIGPNPVDIIKWLLGKYTDYTVDATSFASVKAALTNYPCNFWLAARPNVLDLIQDIAYQSRCGVYIRNNVVSMKYLAVEPTAVRVLSESDIIANTFKIKFTGSEDIATKQDITWQKTGAGTDSEQRTELGFTLKHNIQRYGTSEESHDYYTQNTYSTILKSATFWLIRGSNTWKCVEFSTPLTQLDIDIWDCLELDIAQLSSSAVKCVVTSIQYDWESNSICFEAWTPILAGTTTPYIWAWPAAQNQLATFPSPDDEDQGSGYDFNITPPIDHLLRGGESLPEQPTITGDRHPSDLDDTYPNVSCEISDLVDLDELDFDEVEYLIDAIKSQKISTMRSKMTPQPAGTVEDKKPRKACGMPAYGAGCIYEVTVTYLTPHLVCTGTSPGNPECSGGPCNYGGCGNPCTGTFTNMCFTFGAMFSASLFYSQKKHEGLSRRNATGCGSTNFCSGVTDVYDASMKTIPDPRTSFGECEEAPGDADLPGQGQQYEPNSA